MWKFRSAEPKNLGESRQAKSEPHNFSTSWFIYFFGRAVKDIYNCNAKEQSYYYKVLQFLFHNI